MSRRDLTPAQRREIVRRYCAGESSGQLAQAYNTTMAHVISMVLAAELQSARAQRTGSVTHEERQQAVQSIREGATLRAVCQRYGISAYTARKWFLEAGSSPRTTSGRTKTTTARTKTTRRPLRNADQLQARNAAIIAAVESGQCHASVAQAYGLSRSSITMIMKHHRDPTYQSRIDAQRERLVVPVAQQRQRGRQRRLLAPNNPDTQRLLEWLDEQESAES